jgi:hypothetical protein
MGIRTFFMSALQVLRGADQTEIKGDGLYLESFVTIGLVLFGAWIRQLATSPRRREGVAGIDLLVVN